MLRSRSASRQVLALLLFLIALALAPAACSQAEARSPDSSLATPDSTEMPAYCTAQDVIDAYSLDAIAHVTGDAQGEMTNEAQLQRAVDDYGAHISAHVRMQHPSDPFTAEHEYLNSLNIEGAFLTLRKRNGGGMEENLQDAEERLDELLLQIAEGQLELHALDGSDGAAEDETELNPDELIRAAPRRFGSHRWRERRRLS